MSLGPCQINLFTRHYRLISKEIVKNISDEKENGKMNILF